MRIAIAEALGISAAAKAIEAVAVKALQAEAQQKIGKYPTTKYLTVHRGPNRSDMRSGVVRGKSLFRRTPLPVDKPQQLLKSRKANRWLLRKVPAQ